MNTMPQDPSAAPEVLTTQQAAKRLGVSVSTVQQLVESGSLSAWKTSGGHRRILAESVAHYLVKQRANQSTDVVVSQKAQLLRVLILEDEPLQRTLYQRRLATWSLPAQIKFCKNGYEALIEVALQKPDVFLLDLSMPGLDGFEVLKTITERSDLGLAHLAVLTNLSREEIDARGGLPVGVVFMSKPINFDELRGYLMACCASLARRQDKSG